jgi:hypothetical protein
MKTLYSNYSFFDQGLEGKLKTKIQVPDLLGFEDGKQ